jgi:hypothetical protein
MRFRLVATAISFTLAASAQAQNTVLGTATQVNSAVFGITGGGVVSAMSGGVDGKLMLLSATPRYESPAVTTDGAGTFNAQAGESVGAPNNSGFAGWNFDYAAAGVGQSTFNSLFYVLVDMDPTANTAFFQWNSGASIFDSSNSGYINGIIPGFFNPSAPGEYTIRLEQHNADDNNALVDAVAINVDVESTPEPASLVLIGTGLVGVAMISRRRRSA